MADILIKHLSGLLGPEQVLSEAEELLVYECDGLTHYKHRPRAVVFPHSTEEVSEVVRLLARERVSVVPRGARPVLVMRQAIALVDEQLFGVGDDLSVP